MEEWRRWRWTSKRLGDSFSVHSLVWRTPGTISIIMDSPYRRWNGQLFLYRRPSPYSNADLSVLIPSGNRSLASTVSPLPKIEVQSTFTCLTLILFWSTSSSTSVVRQAIGLCRRLHAAALFSVSFLLAWITCWSFRTTAGFEEEGTWQGKKNVLFWILSV